MLYLARLSTGRPETGRRGTGRAGYVTLSVVFGKRVVLQITIRDQ